MIVCDFNKDLVQKKGMLFFFYFIKILYDYEDIKFCIGV